MRTRTGLMLGLVNSVRKLVLCQFKAPGSVPGIVNNGSSPAAQNKR